MHVKIFFSTHKSNETFRFKYSQFISNMTAESKEEDKRSQQITKALKLFNYYGSLCEQDIDPIFEILEQKIEYADKKCKEGIEYMRKHAVTEPRPNTMKWQNALLARDDHFKLSVKYAFWVTGTELPLEFLKPEYPWMGHPRIRERTRAQIYEQLMHIRNVFTKKIFMSYACNQSVTKVCQKLMKAIYRWVPKTEHDTAVAKSKVAMLRKKLAERLRHNEARLERQVCFEPSCKKFNIKPAVCSRCRMAGYCNEACQKRHWSTHKIRCKEVVEKKNASRETSDPWFTTRMVDGSCESELSPSVRMKIGELVMQHLDAGKGPDDLLFDD